MSGKLVGLVMRGVHGIPHNAKCVLIVLAEHAKSETSPVYPGTKNVATLIDLGERQVRDGFARLIALGWIRQFPKTGRGPGNPAKYAIDFAAMHGPAAEYAKTRTKVVAKAANVATNKAADVHRLWTDEKRRKLHDKAADSEAKAAHVELEKRRTVSQEPYLNRITSTVFEPARAPATQATDQATSLQQIVQPVLESLKGEPEVRAKRDASGELTAEELERRKQVALGQVDRLAAKMRAK